MEFSAVLISQNKQEWETPDCDVSKFVKRSIITFMYCNYYSRLRHRLSLGEQRKLKETILKFLGILGLDMRQAEDRYHDPDWMMEVCSSLLEMGADINATDDCGNTALYYAVALRDLDSVVEFLLDNDIDCSRINLCDVLLKVVDREPTLPIIPVENSETESLIRLLIRRCVDFESEARSGDIILEVASPGRWKEENLSVMNIMIEMIGYEKHIEAKVYEHLGCLAINFKSENSAVWVYWRKAVELRAAHNIKDVGLPYNDVAAFNLVAEENDNLPIINLLFLVVRSTVQSRQWVEHAFLCLKSYWFLRPQNAPVITFSHVFPFAELLLKSYSRDKVSKIQSEFCMRHLISACEMLLHTVKGDKEKEATLEKFVSDIVQMNWVDSNERTFLHLLVDICFNNISDESRLGVMRLMLESGGIDLRAKNVCGRTAFESYVRECADTKRFNEFILELFIEYGTHIDENILIQSNKVRVYDYLKSKIVEFDAFKYEKLQCLAARVVADHNANYSAVKIPKPIRAFIEVHL